MRKIFIGGHSSGAGRAAQYAFHRLMRGLRVDGLILTGCPRPGDHVLRDTLAAYVAPRVSLRNAHDDVTRVPFDWWNAGLEYVDAVPFTDVDVPYDPSLPNWGPYLNGHHVELYRVAAYEGLDSSLPLVDAMDNITRLYHDEDPAHWGWLHAADGHCFAMQVLADGSRLMIPRGTKTAVDVVADFRVGHTVVHGAGLHAGFWAGLAPVLDELDRVLA